MRLVPEWFFRSTPKYRRLMQVRDVFQLKLNASSATSWAPAALALAQKADARLADYDIYGAWFVLMEAMRKEVPYLRGEELWNREQVLRCEAVKIESRWRKSAIDQLMQGGEPDEEKRARRLE